MDATTYDECDTAILRAIAELISCDPYRFPSEHKSRRDHEILAGLVVSEEIKRGIGDDARAVASVLNAKGITVKPTQIRSFFQGRFTPGRNNVVMPIAHAFELPEVRILYEMPWCLLTDGTLSLGEIKKTSALRSDTEFRRSKMGCISSKQSRWYRCAAFNPSGNWLNAPQKPEEFWQQLAAYRAALTLGDCHSVNTHYWNVISNLPSIATHPAVAPHAERLYACVRSLTREIDTQFLWFSINWDTVRETIESRDFGSTCRFKPFHNIFRGNEMHRGRAVPLTEFHTYLQRHHPRVAAEFWLSLRAREVTFHESTAAAIPDPLAALRGDFDPLVESMQTPAHKAAVDALFTATGAEIGAVAAARAREGARLQAETKQKTAAKKQLIGRMVKSTTRAGAAMETKKKRLRGSLRGIDTSVPRERDRVGGDPRKASNHVVPKSKNSKPFRKLFDAVSNAQSDLCKQYRSTLERIADLDPELEARAVEVLGTRDEAARWLFTEHILMNGRSPLEVVASGERDVVLNVLGQIEYGGFV